MKKMWLMPVILFISAVIAGALAKYAFELPRGAFLWDLSLILLGASVFGTAGFVTCWALLSQEEKPGSNQE